jgi:hypothetical protein
VLVDRSQIRSKDRLALEAFAIACWRDWMDVCVHVGRSRMSA